MAPHTALPLPRTPKNLAPMTNESTALMSDEEWNDLRTQSQAVLSLSAMLPPEVEGRFSTALKQDEIKLLERFAARKPLSKTERAAVILMLRQNRRALEHFAALAKGDLVLQAVGA